MAQGRVGYAQMQANIAGLNRNTAASISLQQEKLLPRFWLPLLQHCLSSADKLRLSVTTKHKLEVCAAFESFCRDILTSSNSAEYYS